jgi:hypothetical protein
LRRRDVPRGAQFTPEQSRRQRCHLRALAEGNGDPVGGVPYPRGLRPWPRRLHEHGANSALPKRQPEVIFVIERLIDLAADRLALDPVALRQRNLIPSAAQPYTNPLGLTYHSGDYEQVMERALALADWQGFPARRAEARRRGRWRGIGIANFVEITTGAPASALRSPCSRMGRSSW